MFCTANSVLFGLHIHWNPKTLFLHLNGKAQELANESHYKLSRVRETNGLGHLSSFSTLVGELMFVLQPCPIDTEFNTFIIFENALSTLQMCGNDTVSVIRSNRFKNTLNMNLFYLWTKSILDLYGIMLHKMNIHIPRYTIEFHSFYFWVDIRLNIYVYV